MSTTVYVVRFPEETGLVGTLGFTLFSVTGTVLAARTTAGVAILTGFADCYILTVTLPGSGAYGIVVDDGVSSYIVGTVGVPGSGTNLKAVRFPAETSLIGTLGYTVFNESGTVATARTTAGISVLTGFADCYIASVTLPGASGYGLTWDDGSGSVLASILSPPPTGGGGGLGNLVLSPSALVVGSELQTIYITGVGTAFVTNAVTFAVTGGSGASVSSQSLISDTSAILQIITGTEAADLIVTDGTNSGYLIVRAATSAPDVCGCITARVLSFPTTGLDWQMSWSVGDTEPLISIGLYDGNGSPISLSGASAVTLTFLQDVEAGAPTVVQTSTMTVSSSGLSAFWERQPGDPTTLNAGWYSVRVTATYAGGTGFSAPTIGYLTAKVNATI